MGRDCMLRPAWEATDLQATPLLPWTSVRPSQPRDEERPEDPLRTSLRSAPRSTSSAMRCRGARDARVQAPEEPLVKEQPCYRSTQVKRLVARREEARCGQLPQVRSRCANVAGAACSPTSSPTTLSSRMQRSRNAGVRPSASRHRLS